jgi:phosphoribosylglycinamide formyltransferase-1
VRCAGQTGVDPSLLILEAKAAGDLDDFAATHGVAWVRLDPRDRAAFNAALRAHLDAKHRDLVALTFDRIVAVDLVETYAGRMINVHPSLLPAFAGRDALARALAGGARVGGATIHEVIAAVDAGPIVAQTVVPIERDDDVASYGARMYAQLEPLFLQVLRWYAEDRVTHDEQGRVIIRDARYDALPFVPALEHFGEAAA